MSDCHHPDFMLGNVAPAMSKLFVGNVRTAYGLLQSAWNKLLSSKAAEIATAVLPSIRKQSSNRRVTDLLS